MNYRTLGAKITVTTGTAINYKTLGIENNTVNEYTFINISNTATITFTALGYALAPGQEKTFSKGNEGEIDQSSYIAESSDDEGSELVVIAKIFV